MRLDEKFCLRFITDLTWQSANISDGEKIYIKRGNMPGNQIQ